MTEKEAAAEVTLELLQNFRVSFVETDAPAVALEYLDHVIVNVTRDKEDLGRMKDDVRAVQKLRMFLGDLGLTMSGEEEPPEEPEKNLDLDPRLN